MCTVYSLNLSSSGARADKIPDMARYTRDLDSVYSVHSVTVQYCTYCVLRRRRLNTEKKAKVVAAAWRTELIQLFAALAFCTRMI